MAIASACVRGSMRKSVAVFSAIGIIWVGYTAWPLRHRNPRRGYAARHVYFDARSQSITSQIVTAYTRRTGAHMSAPAQNVAVQGSVVTRGMRWLNRHVSGGHEFHNGARAGPLQSELASLMPPGVNAR
jgi:hypothetical protein